MFSTQLYTYVLLAIGAVKAGPTPIKREPQFDVQLSNNLPVTGALPFGLNVRPGTPGSVVSVGNATTGSAGFPFDFKRQFDVQLPNNLPVTGGLPFGLNVRPGTPGSVVSVGNATTGSTGFPFNFKREPQFDVQLHNNLPVTGGLPFGLNVRPGTPGSVVSVGNATTGSTGFPFNFKREPQFDVQLPNNLPVTGGLPFGLNVRPGTPGSVVSVGNATTGSSGFPFDFKRQFDVQLPNNLPVAGELPFGLNVRPGTPGSVVSVGNATTGSAGFPFDFKRQFDVQLSNELPVNGELPFGLTVAPGTPGSVVSVGNATTGSTGFPFNFKA
ncbi:hypothetical protein PENSPDRAFT_756628 [Peniophora sp. CONT]|nr:hypothetical protein PENSPDRAFT_756628 [Peniophora sp. CONT]